MDPALKARRIAKAALAAYDAGKPDRAARLAVEVTSLTTDPALVADATLLRGQIEYERTSRAGTRGDMASAEPGRGCAGPGRRGRAADGRAAADGLRAAGVRAGADQLG
ncbi:hypothetical protein [Lentzea guizhouensis]|uniref:hypothetical protein n=1 Tax=Lentzea guizhouensis TaxID=1586287 RepID=UPI001C54CBA6|nr:hypothetical protein [Lentzea guizhouensis]